MDDQIASCDEAVIGDEQADMIRFSCWRRDIPTYHTYHIPLLTLRFTQSLLFGCIQEDVLFPFFPFLFVWVFLGPVKVFKLLAFPGRILIYAVVVVGDGVYTRFWIPFFVLFFSLLPCPPPLFFLLYYISFSRVYEPGTGSLSRARGISPFFSVFFSVVVIVRLGMGYFIAWGIKYQHARMRITRTRLELILWRGVREAR